MVWVGGDIFSPNQGTWFLYKKYIGLTKGEKSFVEIR